MLRAYLFGVVVTLLTFPIASLAAEAADPATSLSYLSEEFRPYNYTEYGQPKGLSVDLLKLIWKEMGIDEQPIQFMPWPRAYKMAQNQSGIVLFATLKSPEREQLFKWVGPIAMSKTVLITTKDSPLVMSSLNDAAGKTVAVVQEYASAIMLEKHKGLFQIHTVSSPEIAIKMLANGRVDMISIEERAFIRIVKSMGKRTDDFKAVWLLTAATSYYALSKDTPESLVNRFQKAYDAIRLSPRYDDLIERYLK